MKIQRLLIAVTVFNLGLLAFLLAQIEVRFLGFRFLLRSVEVNSVGSVLRGRALEIVDGHGRIRAAINLYPEYSDVRMPNGPETVILRLIDQNGRPSVKLTTSVQGAGLVLGGEADPTYARLAAMGTTSSLKLTTQDGRQQLIKP
jgi:hypothetical protein